MTSRNDLEDRIASAVAEKRGQPGPQTITLSALTDFPWDRVHVFAPYTTDEQIRESLGFSWSDAGGTRISERDDACVLAFVRNGRVERHVVFPRNRGDFSELDTTRGLTPAEAVFTVVEVQRGEPWVVLKIK